MKIPQFVQDVLGKFEADVRQVMEAEVYDSLYSARGTQGDLSNEDFEGFMAEISAFFFDRRPDEDSPWGTYFAPTFTGTKTDGTVVRNPDIADLSANVVSHWQKRAETTPHPVFKALYADLVWDLCKSITGTRPDVRFARMAIDAYYAAVENSLYSAEIVGIWYCQRALSLSIKIADEERKKAVIKLMFELHDRLADPQKIGSWDFLYDSLHGRKDLISEAQEAEIIKRLEMMLATVTNREDKANFNPWGAEAASERLARHYSKNKRDDEVKRVVAAYGNAFEQLAEGASPMLAMAWLQPVYEKYQQTGMKADAERVQLASLEKAKGIESEMKTVSVRLHIDRKDIDELNNALTEGGLNQSLIKIALNFIPSVQNAKNFLEAVKKTSPLVSFIGVQKIRDGHIIAEAGSIDEDEAGRLYMQIAEHIQLAQPFLGGAIEALKQRYSPTTDQILDFLYQSPVFDHSRRQFIKDGIDAYLTGDYVKAVHTLLPQIEYALRALLPLLGIPLNKHMRGLKGMMQVKSLNDILQDVRVQSVLGEDYHKYLDVFLADPRGHNLRNRVAHGLMDYTEIGRPLNNQVFHVILTMGLFRVVSD